MEKEGKGGKVREEDSEKKEEKENGKDRREEGREVRKCEGGKALFLSSYFYKFKPVLAVGT